MSIKKYIDRLRRIDYLIRTKSTGDINCFSRKLRLSRSSTLEYLKEMKELGFPIKYCNKRKSYYYSEKGKMAENLFENGMDMEEMKKITGGKNISNLIYESGNNGLAGNNFVL